MGLCDGDNLRDICLAVDGCYEREEEGEEEGEWHLNHLDLLAAANGIDRITSNHPINIVNK